MPGHPTTRRRLEACASSGRCGDVSRPVGPSGLGVPVPPGGPGVCATCHGPARDGRRECWCCRAVAAALGHGPGPSPVVPVALCRTGDRLHSVLRGYKDAPAVAARRHFARGLGVHLAGFLSAHGACIAKAAGSHWDSAPSPGRGARFDPAPVGAGKRRDQSRPGVGGPPRSRREGVRGGRRSSGPPCPARGRHVGDRSSHAECGRRPRRGRRAGGRHGGGGARRRVRRPRLRSGPRAVVAVGRSPGPTGGRGGARAVLHGQLRSGTSRVTCRPRRSALLLQCAPCAPTSADRERPPFGARLRG